MQINWYKVIGNAGKTGILTFLGNMGYGTFVGGDIAYVAAETSIPVALIVGGGAGLIVFFSEMAAEGEEHDKEICKTKKRKGCANLKPSLKYRILSNMVM